MQVKRALGGGTLSGETRRSDFCGLHWLEVASRRQLLDFCFVCFFNVFIHNCRPLRLYFVAYAASVEESM